MKKKSGFSLVELSITITILIIMLSFCVHLIFRTAKRDLLDALYLIQIEFITLQQQALSCNRTYELCFSEKDNSYLITQAKKTSTHYLPKNVVFGFIPETLGPPGKPKKPIKKPIIFENPHPSAAIIQPNGRISSGSVYLKHSSGKIMGALSITPHQVAHVRIYLLDEKAGWQIVAE